MARRRTKLELEFAEGELARLCEMHEPLTVRSLFYLAVTDGIIDKSEKGYKWICERSALMRKSGAIKWRSIVDMSRGVRQVHTWENVHHFLADMSGSYRMEKWSLMPERLEVWCEKDAILPVIQATVDKWELPLYSCKGYPSLSLLEEARSMWDKGQGVAMLYFGDSDPTGKDIPRHILKEMKSRALCEDVSLRECAVTPEQIEELSLPTRPTKSGDSRAAKWQGESVEVDAIPPEKLRQILEHSITDAIGANMGRWEELVEHERKEDERIRTLIDSIQ